MDRISQLPDDIVSSIISRLPLREAIATSILSTRWRHLCGYITRLNLPPLRPKRGHFIEYMQEIRYVEEKKFSNYISMINHTVDSHKGGRVLKEFRMLMPYLEGVNINRWLEFVLVREVEIIDMQLFYLQNTRHGCYTLRLSDLIKKNGGQPLPGLKCLKEVSLYMVHVDDREVELLLYNSPLLESLSIAHPKGLKKVSIVGHSVPKLKRLDISYASCIQSIEVCHVINLVSLRCYHLSRAYCLQLNNVPKLIEFSTSERIGKTLAEILPKLPSCILDQIQLLKLWTNTSFLGPDYNLPELINTRHLVLEVPMDMHYYTYQLFPLIEACHSLEKVDIKFLWGLVLEKFLHREIVKFSPTKKLSPNLKKLQVSGYLGSPSELEFVLFVMKNVVAFEELIVQPYDGSRKIRRMATARAWQQLRPLTPASVNLVII